MAFSPGGARLSVEALDARGGFGYASIDECSTFPPVGRSRGCILLGMAGALGCGASSGPVDGAGSPHDASVESVEVHPAAPTGASASLSPAEAAGAACAEVAMVEVPEGPFQLGCVPGDADCGDEEKPRHEVRLDAFEVDLTEVTVDAYRCCVEAGACEPPIKKDMQWCNWDKDKRGGHPVNCVDHAQAKAFCSWMGKRLPTEAEWEKAARGTKDDRLFPWGNDDPYGDRSDRKPDHACVHRANHVSITCKVGSFPSGASPYGALDMAGNVWEWTADWRMDASWRSDNPLELPNAKAVRGGSGTEFGSKMHRVSARYAYEEEARAGNLGFRCARD